MKENKMGNTWHAFIKSSLHISTEKSRSNLLSHLLKNEDGELGGLSNKFT